MTTVWPMNVTGLMRAAVVLGGTSVWICPADGKIMFIDMASMDMMQVRVVEVIRMPVVFDGRVAAIRTVDVCMAFLFVTGFTHISSLCWSVTPICKREVMRSSFPRAADLARLLRDERA